MKIIELKKILWMILLMSCTDIFAMKSKTTTPKKPSSSTQKQPFARDILSIKEKLATDNPKEYIDRSSTVLKVEFDKVPTETINAIAPIYTIGLVNQKSNRLFSDKIETTEMKLPTDWQDKTVEGATDVQMMVAGFQALQKVASEQPIDMQSYMGQSTKMKDYTDALQRKFPHAPVKILEQYVITYLQEQKSGQATWWSGWTSTKTTTHKIITPEDIVKDITLTKETKLPDLSLSEKIYGLLTSTESIIAKNSPASGLDLVSAVGSDAAAVTGRTAVQPAEQLTIDLSGTSAQKATPTEAAETTGRVKKTVTFADPVTETTRVISEEFAPEVESVRQNATKPGEPIDIGVSETLTSIPQQTLTSKQPPITKSLVAVESSVMSTPSPEQNVKSTAPAPLPELTLAPAPAAASLTTKRTISPEHIASKIDQPFEKYVEKAKELLLNNNEKVEPQIISDIAEIYTIGLINQRGDMSARTSKVEPAEISAMSARQDWMKTEPTEIQKVSAGLDALNEFPSKLSDRSYLEPGKKIEDYVQALQQHFSKVPESVLEQAVMTILQTEQSGQQVLFVKKATLTPEQVAQDPLWPDRLNSEGNLAELPTAHQKVYAMLDGIQKIAEQNEVGPTEISMINQATRYALDPVSAVRDGTNTALQYAANSVTSSLTGQQAQGESSPFITRETHQAIGTALNVGLQATTKALGQAARSSLEQQPSLPIKDPYAITQETSEVALKEFFDTAQAAGSKVGITADIRTNHTQALREGISAAVTGAIDYVQKPADPIAKPWSETFKDLIDKKAQDKIIDSLGKLTTWIQDVSYPQAAAKRAEQQKSSKFVMKKDPSSTKFPIASDGKIDGKIPKDFIKENPTFVQKSGKAEQVIGLEASSLETTISQVSEPIASAARNNQQKLTYYMQQFVLLCSRMMGLSKKETKKMQTDMQEEVTVLVRNESSWFHQTDNAKFKQAFNTWIHDTTEKFWGPDNQVIIIPANQSSPLQASVKITYDKQNKSIKSALVTYDGQTYALKTSQILKSETDGTFTITGNLFDKKSQPSIAQRTFFNSRVKSLVDTVRKKDTISPTEQAFANIAETTVQPKSDGMIEIIFDPSKPQAVRQTITKTIPEQGEIKTTKTISSEPTSTDVTLTGIKGDRYLPTINMQFDPSGTLSKVNITHDLVYSDATQVSTATLTPESQTIAYDQNANTCTVTAFFNARQNESKTVEAALATLGQAAAGSVSIGVKHAIFDGAAMQDLRALDPNINTIINETQATSVAKNAISIESVSIKYFIADGSSEVTTIRNLSDGTRDSVTAKYPFQPKQPHQNSTIYQGALSIEAA